MIDVETALELAIKHNINLSVISLKWWRFGLNVETEHYNTVDGDFDTIANIVIDHLLEFPNYYEYLEDIEDKMKLYWREKRKPNIFKIDSEK